MEEVEEVEEVTEVKEVYEVCRGAAGRRATGRVTGTWVLGNWEVSFVGLAENRAGQIINSLYFKLNSLISW